MPGQRVSTVATMEAGESGIAGLKKQSTRNIELRPTQPLGLINEMVVWDDNDDDDDDDDNDG